MSLDNLDKKREKEDDEKREEREERDQPKKKKTRKVKKRDFTSPELMSILGKVFTISHSYRSPDVVRATPS